MRNAYTLVEVMVAIAIMSLILTPAFVLLSSGSRSSLQGLVQVDTTLEARRILRQIRQDLKMATIESGPDTSDTVSLEGICVNSAELPQVDYSFLRFSSHGEIARVAPPRDRRLLSRVHYRLENVAGRKFPAMRLIRKETFHPSVEAQTIEHILSERVNFFEIRPCAFPSVREESIVYQVTLKLVDSLRDSIPESLPNGALVPNHAYGVIVAEYTDVVCPQFFSAYINQPYVVRNYYSGGIAP